MSLPLLGITTELELDATEELLGTRLEELETLEDEERIEELLDLELDEDTVTELELGVMEELLGTRLEELRTMEDEDPFAELELNSICEEPR